jgi:hypothetical protein
MPILAGILLLALILRRPALQAAQTREDLTGIKAKTTELLAKLAIAERKFHALSEQVADATQRRADLEADISHLKSQIIVLKPKRPEVIYEMGAALPWHYRMRAVIAGPSHLSMLSGLGTADGIAGYRELRAWTWGPTQKSAMLLFNHEFDKSKGFEITMEEG